MSKQKTRIKTCSYCERTFKDASRFNRSKYCSYKCSTLVKDAKRYDISSREHQILLNKTKCEICNNGFKDKMDKCIDHCHESGTVRGLLCQKCNRAIGYFGDSAEGAKRVLDYLSQDKILSEEGWVY